MLPWPTALSPTPLPQEITRFLRNPGKPAVLAMSRPDPKKNLTTLVRCAALRCALLCCAAPAVGRLSELGDGLCGCAPTTVAYTSLATTVLCRCMFQCCRWTRLGGTPCCASWPTWCLSW